MYLVIHIRLLIHKKTLLTILITIILFDIKQKCRGTVFKSMGELSQKVSGTVLFPGNLTGLALALSAVKADIQGLYCL